MYLSSLLLSSEVLKQEVFGIFTPGFRVSCKDWLLVVSCSKLMLFSHLHSQILYLRLSPAMPDTPMQSFLQGWVNKKAELSPSLL